MSETRRSQGFALAAVLVAVAAGGVSLHRAWTRELSHLTGRAEWVWVTDSLRRIRPAAGLFVASLRLDAPPAGALLKVCGDREYVVYVNGTAAACGWSRPGFRLDLYDIGHLLHQGDNVLAFEARSPTPVGGLLFALDVDGVGRNILVSGPELGERRWFALGPPSPADSGVPVRWGMPPRFPWGYPPPLSHPRTLDEVAVEEPVRMTRAQAVELEGGGWEFTLPAQVFGYLWLELEGEGSTWVAIHDGRSRFDAVAARDHAEAVVRLEGQRRWLDVEPRAVSRVVVFGRAVPVSIEVWPVPEEFRPAAPGVVPGTYGPAQRTRWTTRTHPG